MKNSQAYRSLIQYAGLVGVLVALVTVFALLSENFLQTRTFISIANQIPDLTLIAVGMTLVLIVGGIDLSVGSVLALSSAVLGALMVDREHGNAPGESFEHDVARHVAQTGEGKQIGPLVLLQRLGMRQPAQPLDPIG